MSLETFPPLVLIATRFILSGTIMMVGALAWGARLPRGRDLWKAGLTGVLILSIGNGCLTFAELRIASGLASLIITLSPFWLVGIEGMAPGGERLHPPTILGMVVGFGGAALLVSGGIGSGGFSRAALGGFLILQAGMISWSAGSIYQRKQQVDAHPIVIGAVQQVFGGLAALPFALLASSHHIAWSVRGVSALFYLVTFGSIVGYSAYIFVLDRLPVSVISIYNYINPVVALFLGWWFYREHIGIREVIAMLIIFAGVALVKRYARSRAPAPVPVSESS